MHQSVAPNWRPGPQPRHVPRLGIEPAALGLQLSAQFTEPHRAFKKKKMNPWGSSAIFVLHCILGAHTLIVSPLFTLINAPPPFLSRSLPTTQSLTGYHSPAHPNFYKEEGGLYTPSLIPYLLISFLIFYCQIHHIEKNW